MKKLLAIIISFCMFFGFSSCNDEEPENIQVEQTLFMYFPWSTNLTFSLDKNVADMQAAFAEYGTDKEVCQNVHLLLFTYKAPTFTSWGFVIT